MAREQWLGDQHQLRQQRQQELSIATAQRDEQRIDSVKRYEEQLLLDHVKEIGELLRESNGSLMSTTITRTLARAKTLNAFRQLDRSRSKLVIQFLYEALQLTDTKHSTASDISKATLIGIDGSALNTLEEIETLSLRGMILKNSTVSNSRLGDIDLSSVQRFYKINFSSAELDNVDFSSIQRFDKVDRPPDQPLSFVDFVNRQRIHNVDFSSAQMNRNNFSSAELIASPLLKSAPTILQRPV